MDEILRALGEFARDYWWLVFPFMGVAGGVAKAWERGAKRRHQRRLETIRVKGEIKAAQLAARGKAGNLAILSRGSRPSQEYSSPCA